MLSDRKVCILFQILQGLPSPESERNAIEVVIQYAIEKLGFPANKIIIYAWSIGECFVWFLQRSTDGCKIIIEILTS